MVIQRENGADGNVEVTCITQDKTAIDGKDYIGGTYKIQFRSGETTKLLKIPIINDMSAVEKAEVFEVEIVDINCEGAYTGSRRKTIVTIANDENFNEILDNMMDLTTASLDDISLFRSSWSDHLKDSIQLNGGKLETATFSDYVMHFLTFGLKVLFSSCPPPGMLHGWPSFIVALIYIGLMAALIRLILTTFS